VESIPGSGSTFTLKIPRSYGKGRPLAGKDTTEAPGGPVILFVEDNREAVFVYETSLKNSRYHLEFASTLNEARAATKRVTPSLVVLDRLIAEEDSLYFIEELRSGSYLGPLLVVSVMDDPQAALSAGANAFLAKPIVPFTLLSTVRELIDGQSVKTLLLVDDDEVTRYLLGEALSKLGYRILEARNGREAIRIFQDRVIEGMFLDLMMPGIDGFETLRELRASGLKGSIPIIVHSSKNLSPSESNLIADMRAIIYSKQDFAADQNSEALRRALKEAGIEP
jgi:CheY-like chemotaxis protein